MPFPYIKRVLMNKYLSRRYVLFIISLFINSLGIAIITRALLGTSPITSVNYVLSFITPLTMGEWTIIVNILFVILELFMMKREELMSDLRIFLLQIPVSLCFGIFIDCSMNLINWYTPITYPGQIAGVIAGCIVLAAGIALEVKANVAMLSGEYFVQVISRRLNVEFGYVKLGFDITLVAISCILSYAYLSGLYGVREGTVIAALTVGPIVRFLMPYYGVLDKWINAERHAGKSGRGISGNIIITIARQYGSGGHLLGEMLSRELGIKLYDSDFISLAARKSGLDEDYIKANEQNIPSFWLKCITGQNYKSEIKSSFSPDDILFVSESKIITELSEKESCIIVGRCADFVLKDYPGVIKVFCYSGFNDACNRCVELYGIPKEKAETEVKRINRHRAIHYGHYTGMKWGDPHNYDLMINTSRTPLNVAYRMIKELYSDFRNRN